MSDRPLTILQLTHQGGGSGSTTIIADLSRQLARRGHRVLVGCRPDTKLAHLARDAGLELVSLDFRRLGPLARALEEVTDREGVDVVNSNATRDRRALTWLRWTRRLGRPFVVTRHTMPLTSPAELVAVGLSADRTIAVSHAVARALRCRLHPGGRLRVVTNGIDLARVDAAPSEADLAAARAALGDLAEPPVVRDGWCRPVIPPRGRGRWRGCSTTGHSQSGWRGGDGSWCGASSRSRERRSGPRTCTARLSSGVGGCESDPAAGLQFPSAGGGNSPDDGRVGASLPTGELGDLHRDACWQRGERSDLPAHDRSGGRPRDPPPHAERPLSLDRSCRITGATHPTGVRV